MYRLARSKYALPLVLLVLGLVSRFAFIWHPREVVFDETHFGKFINAYFTGEYFFDIHPPLGKLLIALAGYIGGFEPGFGFEAIGEPYPDGAYIALRVVPNLFGAMLVPCVYLFVLSLKGSRMAAMLAGLAVALENALLVQSHFILLDSAFLFFGFGGLALFFFYRNYPRRTVYLIGAGVFLGCAFSVKWTGLSFLGLGLAVALWDLTQGKYRMREVVSSALALVVLPILINFSVFTVHFYLLDKSGPGNAFMSERFNKTLVGSNTEHDPNIEPLGFAAKFQELNKTMFTSNVSLGKKHPYASPFYTWPVMARSVYYWNDPQSSDGQSRVYLTGNPMVWWLALGMTAAGLFLWWPSRAETKWILYFGWVMNVLPFYNIERVMFQYHYFPALIFSIVIMGMYFSDALDDYRKYRTALFVALVALFYLGFIFFAPLTYGFPLSEKQFLWRIWFKGWM